MFTTDKPVNVSQLGYELGCVPAKWFGPDADGVVTMTPLDDAAITQEQWDAAVAAHVADDGWVNPDRAEPEAEPTFEEQVQAAASALIGDALAGADNFTEFKAAFAPSGQ